jgi:hypothetical protein
MMGKLWDRFKDKLAEMAENQNVTVEMVPAQQKPMRSWRNELLSDEQRRDLEEVVNLPGYEVLQDLGENVLEGFITYLVQLDPSETQKVLAAHKLVHAGYLFQKSVQTQVSAYMELAKAENEEAAELKAALLPPSGNPLDNQDRLAKLLNPIHVPTQEVSKELTAKQKRIIERPLDTMLKERE